MMRLNRASHIQRKVGLVGPEIVQKKAKLCREFECSILSWTQLTLHWLVHMQSELCR